MSLQKQPIFKVIQLLHVSLSITATQTNDNGHARGVPEKYVRTLFPLFRLARCSFSLSADVLFDSRARGRPRHTERLSIQIEERRRPRRGQTDGRKEGRMAFFLSFFLSFLSGRTDADGLMLETRGRHFIPSAIYGMLSSLLWKTQTSHTWS